MKKVILSLICVAVVCGAMHGSLTARPQYYTEFEALYVSKDPKTDAEKALAEAVAKAKKCGVCHVGKDKKVRNDYGKAFGKGVGAKNSKDKAKIVAALKAAADMKDGDTEVTFGENIAAGKLPCEHAE